MRIALSPRHRRVMLAIAAKGEPYANLPDIAEHAEVGEHAAREMLDKLSEMGVVRQWSGRELWRVTEDGESVEALRGSH